MMMMMMVIAVPFASSGTARRMLSGRWPRGKRRSACCLETCLSSQAHGLRAAGRLAVVSLKSSES
jgi:hypothetical protein